MKTCPECAESVQDAARKCRFCGYRFDGAPVPPDPAPSPAAPATRTARPPWPFLLVAGGGASLSFGGLAMGYLFATGEAFPLITIGAFALGGVLLAAGWASMFAGGEVSLGSIAGGLALTACWVGAALLHLDDGPLEQMVKGMLGTVGLFLCALMHLNTLELQGLGGARKAAMVAIAGFGIELAAVTKKLPLPEAVQAGLMWAGVAGTVLFGIALVLGGCSRFLNSPAR